MRTKQIHHPSAGTRRSSRRLDHLLSPAYSTKDLIDKMRVIFLVSFLISMFTTKVFGFMMVQPRATAVMARSSSLSMSADSDAVQSGKVKWFDTTKGFGFISPVDGSSDVFVHQSEIQMEGFRSLAEEEDVEYRVETDKNGRKKAVHVTGPGGVDVQGAPYKPREDFNRF